MPKPDSGEPPAAEEVVHASADPELGEPILLEASDDLDGPADAVVENRVRVRLSSCATGCVTRFLVPPPQVAVITCRFRFAIGGRNLYSGFAYRSGAYPGFWIATNYPYRIPTGTTQIWGYWWTAEVPAPTPVPAYYGHINVRC